MSSIPQEALANYLISIADDEMILAHRDSEWAGHAPILEEDIAFANIALDEMGHAALWYRVAGEHLEDASESFVDEIIFSRAAPAYRNVQMVELPNGDWAFTVLRQYLFDVAESARLEALMDSEYAPLADAATKMRPEELYHLRHTSAWVRRLGSGTKESNRRMQTALDDLYPLALQLFEPQADESDLARLVPAPDQFRSQWEQTVRTELAAAELIVPDAKGPPTASRAEHTEHLNALIAELQEVARAEIGAEW